MSAADQVIRHVGRWILPTDLRASLRRSTGFLGYDTRDWNRIVMRKACDEFMSQVQPSTFDALEISGGKYFEKYGFRSLIKTSYPDFDICKQSLDSDFDLIIADQVFEHLKWPYRAGRNVYGMLRPGGWFLIAVPFMIRIHEEPLDCTRWSEDGLRYFLAECGWELDQIKTGSWGNRGHVRGQMAGGWPMRGFFGSLKNESAWPTNVWAFAQK